MPSGRTLCSRRSRGSSTHAGGTVQHLQRLLWLSERFSYRVTGQRRATQPTIRRHYFPRPDADLRVSVSMAKLKYPLVAR